MEVELFATLGIARGLDGGEDESPRQEVAGIAEGEEDEEEGGAAEAEQPPRVRPAPQHPPADCSPVIPSPVFPRPPPPVCPILISSRFFFNLFG